VCELCSRTCTDPYCLQCDKGKIFKCSENALLFSVTGDGTAAIVGIGDAVIVDGVLLLESNVVSPDGTQFVIVAIADNAFKGNRDFKSVIVPQSVVTIGKMAFYGSGLTHVELHKDVKEVGALAFAFSGFLNTYSLKATNKSGYATDAFRFTSARQI